MLTPPYKKPKAKRIRGRTLQNIRKAHFKEVPYCVECAKRGIYVFATELDHIIALDNGGEETPENRQGLCEDCHKKKTAIDLNYKPKSKIGIDGFPIDS